MTNQAINGTERGSAVMRSIRNVASKNISIDTVLARTIFLRSLSEANRQTPR